MKLSLGLLLLLVAASACAAAEESGNVSQGVDAAGADAAAVVGPGDGYLDAPYATLSEYRLSSDVLLPYEVHNALFTDYADKTRSLYLPPGTRAKWVSADAPIDLPVGAILVKQFAYGERKIETRLLIHRRDGWKGHAYLWDEDQKEARLRPGGGIVELDTPKGHVTHLVPSELQCIKCHADNDQFVPIGMRPTLFDHGDQLARIVEGAPPSHPVAQWNDPASGTTAERARAYLDANCGHCHNDRGSARTTGLWLRLGDRPDLQLGLCKPPVAAGRGSGDLAFDVVPGKPDDSILIRRMRSTEPQQMMPEIGRSLVHEEGVAVVAEWIASLTGECK